MSEALKDTSKRIDRHICIGIMAHVDAGKTTLSEALLFKTGVIKKPGRVDHGNAFLDTDAQERTRGITIFSKQAEMLHGGTRFTLLDTPGHVDFSSETERTLQVLDYAVLVVSGKDGIQGHTITLWRLLKKYGVPVFIFINKTDMAGVDIRAVLEELQNGLDDGCCDFSGEKDGAMFERIAMCDEALLDEFVETGRIEDEGIRRAIAERRIFPCYAGSALRIEGVDELLDGLSEFCSEKSYGGEFGARVYKITRDDKGNRLTHMKVTGGALRTRDALNGEKVEQIRVYSGEKYRTADKAVGGEICAVTGLKKTYAGQGLGFEADSEVPMLGSVLLYSVRLPQGADTHDAFVKLKLLEEEDPQLHVVWDERSGELRMQLMGEVQTEVVKEMISERFGLDVEFGSGSITYKETIAEPVTGTGHFEPLRHFAHVQLLLEPAERGSGLTFRSSCSEDVLDRNWQRLIMTHLAEKEHIGALTGSGITDMRITLTDGKAHLKHTEGGDFRQATYRALRQGLRKAKPLLLEPWYEFRMEIPAASIGRAMSDIQRMSGVIGEPETLGDTAVLSGRAPVSEMKDYRIELASYTKGVGRLTCSLCGYELCHDTEKVAESIGYDPDRDTENTADSVFCAHGAGFTVKWDEVDDYLTRGGYYAGGMDANGAAARTDETGKERGRKKDMTEDEELERIFEMTYGKPKRRTVIPKREITPPEERIKIKPSKVLEEYLLVDGYNIIFAWDDLKELAKVNMDSARQTLIDILANYQGYKKCHVIAVFDAYKVKGGERRAEKHENIDVIYTGEAETADMYIEKTAHAKSGEYHVRVATSDRLEQTIITGSGAFKISADEFREEIKQADTEISRFIEAYNMKNRQKHRNNALEPFLT